MHVLGQTLGQNDKRLLDIMTALSFQDLVAQSVNKLVTILDEVEHRLLQLVVVFGPYQKQAAKTDQSKASEMLKQLKRPRIPPWTRIWPTRFSSNSVLTEVGYER